MLPYQSFARAKVVPKTGPHRVYGTLGDAYLQNIVLQSLLDWSLPAEEGGRDFNMDTLDGESASITDVLSRCGNLPFLAERRVVLVQRAEKLEGLSRGGDEKSDGAKPRSGKGSKSSGTKESPAKRFASGIENLPASTVLILSRTAETPEAGARKETPRCINAAVDRVLEEHGVVIDCTVGAKAGSMASAIVNNEAARLGIPLGPNAAEHLVQRAGHNIAGLLNELEKCALRAGIGQPVTTAVIDDMVKRAPQETIFDLTDALGARQGPRAIGLLHELIGSGEPPELVLAMLVRHLRHLLQARACLDVRAPVDAGFLNRVPPAVAAQFPREGLDSLSMQLQSQGWKGRIFAQQARNFSTPQLQDALQAALAADLAMKGIEGDGGAESKQLPELLLELFVARLC
jgi:DNA polymerase-3 subunit delta